MWTWSNYTWSSLCERLGYLCICARSFTSNLTVIFLTLKQLPVVRSRLCERLSYKCVCSRSCQRKILDLSVIFGTGLIPRLCTFMSRLNVDFDTRKFVWPWRNYRAEPIFVKTFSSIFTKSHEFSQIFHKFSQFIKTVQNFMKIRKNSYVFTNI